MRRCALFAVLLSNRPAPQETGEVANGSADTHGETPHNHAMKMLSSRTRYVLDRPWRFVGQVVAGFRANQGFLLAGAWAYYTLLSIIPMFALILVLLSQFQETAALLTALDEYLMLVAPGQTKALVAQIGVFLENWKVGGETGLAQLVVFSSVAIS